MSEYLSSGTTVSIETSWWSSSGKTERRPCKVCTKLFEVSSKDPDHKISCFECNAIISSEGTFCLKCVSDLRRQHIVDFHKSVNLI